MNKAPLQDYFKPFNNNSLDATLWLYLSNIAYYKTNIDSINLYDKYTIFDNAKDKEKIIKKWEQEIKKSIKAMKHIEVRYLYDYPIRNSAKIGEGATSFYYDIPDYALVDNKQLIEDAQDFKDSIIRWEQELTAGYFKNRNIHTISISIAPRKEIPYTIDKKGNKKPKAGNSKTSTAFNYFLVDIDIEEWKKPDYEPTEQEINKYCNIFLNALPEMAYKPYIIGFTGAGLRFIWYFNRPITKLEIPILKRIAQDLKNKTNLDVDLGVYDISRVDRILGTQNKKRKYGTPRQSRILYYNPYAYNYIVEEFYKQLGYDIKKVLDIIENENNKTNEDMALETINKLKRNSTIKEFKELDKETYKKTKRIQRELHEKGKKDHNNNYGWIVDLLKYLEIGYKPVGNRIHIYSLYCNDGDNPDTAIYINKGYDAVVKDFHLDTSFNVVAYLWMAYKDRILEYLNNKGLGYSLEDTEDIFNVIDDFFKIDTKKIDIDRYIKLNDIKRIIENKEHKTIGIKAPTGAGKTTAIINYAVENNVKIIFLVPYYSMALQQATQNKIKGFIGLHQDHEETEETIKKATKIIATYDQLNKIVEIKGTDDLKDYLLVIDEYHNIITQYDLRYKAINRILDYKEAFNKVIYLSGTYEGLNIENNKIYEFKPKHQRKNNYNIIVCKNNEGLGHLMDELKRIDTSTGKYLAFINNIELIKEIEQELKGHGIDNIHILTAPNKDNPIMDNIYNEECLKEAGIYLTTSLICDGINIKDKDVKKIYIYGVNDIYQIGQYIARVRNTEPDIIHIIEPKEIKGMEPYNNYIQSIRAIIQPIIYTLNENRKEAKERGMDDKDTEVYKKIEKIPIFKEEMYIKYDIYKDQYREDIYKITKSYIDRLNIRIINNPQLIKRVLLKFYPALNITIEKIENKETIKEVAGGRTKEYLIKSIIKYGYDTIQEIKSYKGRDELKLIDKTGIQDIEELTTIKEVSKRHRDALKNIRELKEFRSFGFDINVKEKNIIKVKEKYNIKELPKELEKEIYVMAGNPKSIGKEFNILKMAKNILLDRQGLIPKGNPTLKEVWDYRIRKIILDDVLEANNNNKNINIPTILVKVREFIKENGGDDEEDKKNKQVINKDKVIEIIKEYAKITIKNETITVKKIDDRILEAYNRKVEKAKNYLEILKEHTGEQLHEEDLLELLDNNNDVLKHYIQLGYIHNIRWEYYLIDV